MGRCSRCGGVNGGFLNPLFLIPVVLAAGFVALRHFLTFQRNKRVKKFGRAQQLFEELDENKDGIITRPELLEGLQLLPGMTTSEDSVIELIDEIDLDHSGDIDEHEWLAWMEQNRSALQTTMAVGKIVVGLGQVLAKQPEVLKSEQLTQQFADAQWLQLFAFNFAWVVPVCEISYVTTFLSNTVVLPGCLFLLVAATWRFESGGNDQQQQASKGTDGTDDDNDVEAQEKRIDKYADYYFALFLCYPTQTATFFNHLKCRSLGPLAQDGTTPDSNGEQQQLYVLERDYEVVCYEGSWWWLAGFSVLGIVLISVGVPLGMFIWMRRKMRKEMQIVKREQKSKVFAYRAFHRKFGYMTADFKPDAYYAECLDLIRKLVMTGVLTWITPGTVLQGVCSVLFSLFFLIAHIKVWPYSSTSTNLLKALADLEIFFVTQVGLVLRIRQHDLDNDHVLAQPGATDWWTGSLYGDLLWVLLLATVVAVLFALFHKSDVQKTRQLLYNLSKITAGEQSQLARSRMQLQQRGVPPRASVRHSTRSPTSSIAPSNTSISHTSIGGRDRATSQGATGVGASDASIANQWIERYSKEHQRTYWVNRVSKQSTWNPPPAEQQHQSVPASLRQSQFRASTTAASYSQQQQQQRQQLSPSNGANGEQTLNPVHNGSDHRSQQQIGETSGANASFRGSLRVSTTRARVATGLEVEC